MESCGSVSKESAATAGAAGDMGSILGPGRSLGEGNNNALQYSCLGNHMDREAWQATDHWVARVGHDLTIKPPPQTLKIQHLSRTYSQWLSDIH